MNIELKKFGTVLTSRQAGKEALSAFIPTLNEVKDNQDVIVDFDGVTTFSPSWGDEFIRPLHEKFGERLILKVTNNLSVKLSLEILEESNGIMFQKN
jgi:NAD(P)H-dependent flavin oxidoreductase YrpB (nitropropane dioxygenase family)